MRLIKGGKPRRELGGLAQILQEPLEPQPASAHGFWRACVERDQEPLTLDRMQASFRRAYAAICEAEGQRHLKAVDGGGD